MVDYSKWDRMDFGDSDSESEVAAASSTPRVTSLNRPGRVTIGRDGGLEIGESSSNSNSNSKSKSKSKSNSGSSPSSPYSGEEGVDMLPTVSGGVGGDIVDISSPTGDDDVGTSPVVSSSEIQSRLVTRRRQRRDGLTRNGGEHHVDVDVAVDVDGGVDRSSSSSTTIRLPTYWSQDRSTVVLRLGIPPSVFPTRSVRVRVTGASRYEDRFSAVGSGIGEGGGGGGECSSSSFGAVEIVSLSADGKGKGEGGETVLLSGELPRPVHLEEGEDEIDFEIEDHPLDVDKGADDGGNGGGGCAGDRDHRCTKLVTIVLPKATPMAGVVLWWDRPLAGYPQIDVSAIPERKSNNGGDPARHGTEDERKKDAFQKAWDEAHDMFREKMKTRKKESIEVDD